MSQTLSAGSVLERRTHVNSSSTLLSSKRDLRVVVWDRERGLLSDLIGRAIGKNIVQACSKPFLVRVKVCDDGELHVAEVALLNQDLSTHTRINARGLSILEAAAVDVPSSEAEGWETGVDVDPAVVVVGNLEEPSILIGIAVRVADQ
jgi:hypothetical protein